VLEPWIGQITAGGDLSIEQTSAAMTEIMAGHCTDGEIGVFLTALAAKGEAVTELVGAAQTLRQFMVPIVTRRTGLIDTCGPGGDGSGTFNISTAAAIVTAAAGVPVAKHGNRKVTSRSGSADVLVALGVNVQCEPPVVERCLDEVGIGFCFAPALHPAMKRVADVRRQLGIRTIFNLLGPLSNPARAPFQLMGVPTDGLRGKMAAALKQLGLRRACVVWGEDGLDEVTLGGRTFVSEVRHDNEQASEVVWTPEELGLQTAAKTSLRAEDAAASAAIIQQVLRNEPGPARDIVVANAAAALFTAEKVPTIQVGVAMAHAAIASGAAADTLRRLAAVTQGR